MGKNARLRTIRRGAKAFHSCETWPEALNCAIETFAKFTKCPADKPVWGCTYWHGDYSVGGSGYSLGDAIDFAYDLDFEWQENPLAVFNKFAEALMTGGASFGSDDFGLSIYFEES
jgi:hypothetical protein